MMTANLKKLNLKIPDTLAQDMNIISSKLRVSVSSSQHAKNGD